MMKLKHFSIFLSIDHFPTSLASDFGFRTRCICSFIERALAKTQFEATGFNQISIKGVSDPKSTGVEIFENSLVIHAFFDRKKYELTQPCDLHEFIISLILIGLRQLENSSHKTPSQEIADAIQAFRDGGCLNEWTYQTKKSKSRKTTAILHCKIDLTRFLLSLEIQRNGETVIFEKILETKPDELIFKHKFKEIHVSDDEVRVTDRFGNELYAVCV